MIFFAFISAVLVIIGISIGIWKFIYNEKPTTTLEGKIMSLLIFLSLIISIIVLTNHSTPYYKDIDPFTEPCYSPISYRNAGFLMMMHILSIFSMIILYIKELKLPPIPLVLLIILLTFGIVLNIQFLYHISYHDTTRIVFSGHYNSYSTSFYLAIYPTLLIISAISILLKLIKNKSELNTNTQYKNKWLNLINNKLQNVKNLPLTAILLSFPVFIIFVIILILFGQDIDSLTKVYTETATWRLSGHIHPPTVDDRHGHYLCTVAAQGTPKIVKPTGIGKRNHSNIIINRQLQIANAFECLVERISPASHRIIRENYDKYGLNLSRRINTERLSNLTYFLMKPIEWIFLISLYSFCIKPEELIKKQYR